MAKERTKRGQERKRQREEQESDAAPLEHPDSEPEPHVADLKELKDWLQSQVPSKLSAAQAGLHLLLQILRSKGDLADYARRSLLEEPNVEVSKRWRNLLPLPLWPDVWSEMYQVLEEECFKNPPKGEKAKKESGSKAKAARNLRLSGMLVWHGLIVIGLNFEATGCSASGQLPKRAGHASQGQERCLLRIWEFVKGFVDEKGLEKGMGVPRTPDVDWGKEVEKVRISYTGEVVEKARPLTLRQILPGLPSAQHGAIVPLLDVVSGEVREKLMDPQRLIKSQMDEALPKPRVLAKDGEWPKIAKALYERGLVRPVSRAPVCHGEKALNGAFGVVKEGKQTDEGEEVLRFIMDLRATNAIMEVIEGDIKTLSGCAAFQHIVLEDGDVLALSGDDLTAAFYLFGLPQAWSELMVFNERVRMSDLGLEGDKWTYLGAAALPMGWASAVGVMQHVHRELALRPQGLGAGLDGDKEIRRDVIFPEMDESGPLWSIYLDDTTFLEKVSKKASAILLGKPPEQQAQLRAAYAWWGIPTNPKKAMERVTSAERLGGRFDGVAGTLGGSVSRKLELIGLGSFLRSQDWVSRKQLQIYAGKAVHLLQFRRCMFSFLSTLWSQIAGKPESFKLLDQTVDEMLALEMCLPMCLFNLRAGIDDLVTASDACESGGGTCYSNRLSHAGVKEAKRLMEGEPGSGQPELEDHVSSKEKIVVFDFFGGVGGLLRGLDRAGVSYCHVVVVEKDKDLRRLHRRVWPGSEEKLDISKLEPQDFANSIKKIPGVTGVIAGGGSPCQGISSLSSERRHFDDERSALFFKFAEHLRALKKECDERKIWFWGFGENVIGDERDVDIMTRELGYEVYLIDPAHFSRARRPRLYWSSEKLTIPPWVEAIAHEKFVELVCQGPLEPLEAFLGKEVSWEAGSKNQALKFPTFTRAIPRKRPPPQPAGLDKADEDARARWQKDEYKYPPYTYAEQYMVELKGRPETRRPLNSREREILTGFPPGHLAKMHKKEAETELDKSQQEVQACAAIGNSFHTGAMAILADIAMWSLGKKVVTKGITKMQDEFLVTLSEEEVCVEPSEAEDEAAQSATEEADADFERSSSEESDMTSQQVHKMEQRRKRPWRGQTLVEGEITDQDKQLKLGLVSQFVRRQEYRGCDVRLDVGLLYRPEAYPRTSIDPRRWAWVEAHAYPFLLSEHINVLELRALLLAFEWRSRRASWGDKRMLHLTDSQVALAVACKGRSSSKVLNRILRRFAALQLAGGVYPLLAWVESHLNPADAPSRKFE